MNSVAYTRCTDMAGNLVTELRWYTLAVAEIRCGACEIGLSSSSLAPRASFRQAKRFSSFHYDKRCAGRPLSKSECQCAWMRIHWYP